MFAIFGTFDVDNYGDLLFPIIARWRLGENLLACSPTRTLPKFQRPTDVRYISFDDFLDHRPRAILVGGGNILHFRKSSVKPYKWRYFSYAGLQIIPFLFKKYYNIPYLYNAPSIASRKDWFIWKALFRYLFANASYLSFRDPESVKFASSISDFKVHYVPDTAFDVSRVWARDASIRAVQDRYVIVHVNKRYGGSVGQVAEALDHIAVKLEVRIVFLPIGPCHGDLDYANDIYALMSGDGVVVTQFDTYLFAQYIANSEMYLGSSMHGFITALSYGVRAALVLREEPIPKFIGALSAAALPNDYYFSSWHQLSRRVQEVVSIDESRLSLIFERLDEHWLSLKERTAITPSVYVSAGRVPGERGLRRALCAVRLLIWIAQLFEKLGRLSMPIRDKFRVLSVKS